MLDPDNTSAEVWADAAYRSKACEQSLKDEGYRSHIHTKGQAKKPISACQQRANHKRSKQRCRVDAGYGRWRSLIKTLPEATVVIKFVKPVRSF